MMTDDEAKEALKALALYYKEPVLPMSKFCSAITTWFRCIEENNQEAEAKNESGTQGTSYWKFLGHIEMDIRKSSLLARLLYGGETFRTEKCPEHQGTWSGIGECKHGCDSVGWLRK